MFEKVNKLIKEMYPCAETLRVHHVTTLYSLLALLEQELNIIEVEVKKIKRSKRISEKEKKKHFDKIQKYIDLVGDLPTTRTVASKMYQVIGVLAYETEDERLTDILDYLSAIKNGEKPKKDILPFETTIHD